MPLRCAADHAARAGTPVFLDAGPLLAHVLPDHPARGGVGAAAHDRGREVPWRRTGEVAYAALLASGPATLVVRLHDHHPRRRARLPGYPAQVVDTTGAGDRFDAAFVVGLPRGCRWLTAAAGQRDGRGGGRARRAQCAACADVI